MINKIQPTFIPGRSNGGKVFQPDAAKAKFAALLEKQVKMDNMTSTVNQATEDLSSPISGGTAGGAVNTIINDTGTTDSTKVKSIYDIPPSELQSVLQQARQAIYDVNTEGMTKAEIYNIVESIFTEYLGKDFRVAHVLGNWAYMGLSESHINDLRAVSVEFVEQISRYGMDYDGKREALIEARGYAGMSENEMREAVRSQYPEVMTLRDCLYMARELTELGLDKNYGELFTDRINSTISRICMKPDYSYIDNFENVHKSIVTLMLDSPAEYEAMKTAIDATTIDGAFHAYNLPIDELYKELFSWIGGNGLYSPETLNMIMELLNEAYDKTMT